MSRLDLNKLNQYRDEILKAEIGALLFNLGKTHIGFWKEKEDKNGKRIIYFDVNETAFKSIYGFKLFNSYKKYYQKDNELNKSPFEYELEKYGLKDFIFDRSIKFPFSIDTNNEIKWVSFFKGDALEDNESGKNFIQKIFFRGCENINSGIDKGSPNEQLKPPLWLSNAFGSFKEKIKEYNFDQRRLCFYSNLSSFLSKNGYFLNPNWKDIRNFVLKEIKDWYSHLLSDSRFPVNDVTLWDQAYMTASMFKAVLSQLVMDSSKLDEYQSNPSSIKWRILGIQYDKLGLIEKSLKLASIQWYREITKKIDKEIKKLLEIEYPIGNEIYRDETGIYFVVGKDLGKDVDNNSNLAKLKLELKEIEEKIYEIFKRETEDEFYPAIFLTKASRGLMNLSYLLENAKNNFLKVKKKKDLNLWLLGTKKGKAIGICPICQVRLIYESDKEKNNSPIICEVCDNRIHHKQVSKWINNISNETIWIEEIKDKNNRVAYISLKFELEDWLNGNLLNSLLGNKGLNNYNLEKTKIKELILNGTVKEEKANIIDKILVQRIKILEKLNENLERLKNSRKFNDLRNKLQQNSLNKEIGNIAPFFNNTTIKNIVQSFEEIRIELINISDQFMLVHSLENLNSKIKEKVGNIYDKVKVLKEKKDLISNLEQILMIIDSINLRLKDYFLEIIELLDNLKEEDINIEKDFVKKLVKENLYPFSINEELLNYYSKYTDKSGKPSIYVYFKSVIFEAIKGNQWEEWLGNIDFLKEKIDFKNEKINWDLIKKDERALDLISSLLLQFLLRKNPSPARLRRIWETTRGFFEDIHKNLDEILEIPEWRKKRLVWDVDLSNLKKSMELEGDGLLFWAEKDKNKIYLISSIEDFLNNFGSKEIKEALNKEDNDYLTSLFEKLNKLKSKINVKEIDLKPYNSKYSEENSVKIITNEFIEAISYKPFAKITDPSPKRYQVIIPADRVEIFIDRVIERYDKEFKYVYGKLPIHIGVIVSNYKKPAYVNLKALRSINRDVKDINYFRQKVRKNKFAHFYVKKLKFNSKEYRDNYLIEIKNKTHLYYSLYWFNPNKKDYNFYIKPNSCWKKWIAFHTKFKNVNKITYYPNTFDFEFMDTNIRRNDIFYSENNKYKRAIKRKSNRPYEIEEYWDKFKAFKKLVTDESYKRSRLFKIIEIVYSKLQEIEELNIDYSYMFAPIFYRYLDLKDKGRRKIFRKIFDIDENLSSQDYIEKLREVLSNKTSLYLFIDMFEFWHTALKEV